MIYDIFFVSNNTVNKNTWEIFSKRFPTAQKIDNIKSLNDIAKKSFTSMFWVVWDDVIVSDDFDFSYRVPSYDRDYIHVWKNDKFYDGIFLFPKSRKVTDKEFQNRFFISDKKEFDIVASRKISWDLFYVSKTTVNDTRWNNFRERFPRAIKIENITDFDEIKDRSATRYFWVMWDDLEIVEDFDFEYRVPYWEERKEIHSWKNGEYYNGISLFPMNVDITDREFQNRFYLNKIEFDRSISRSMIYDIFYVSTHIIDDNKWIDFQKKYPTAQKKENLSSSDDIREICKTDFYWIFWADLDIEDDFDFNFFPAPWDREFIHCWKNDKFYDGIVLIPKNRDVTKKEFQNRFYISEKKEIDRSISRPSPFDIVFISYNEPNADENYNLLKSKFPRAKRVHGIVGIVNAHKEAAKISTTDLFWVVDGDAIIDENFDFLVPQIANYDFYNKSVVNIWLSRNPINDLVYGYGGVKLLPKDLTLRISSSVVDMTTSISENINVKGTVSNITAFNTDPFNTWKSAFRECVKLASKVIDKNYDESTEDRLRVWCTVGIDRPFGKYALSGARMGADYGESNIDNKDALAKINDFNWLEELFRTVQIQD
jgi:hypothetical protein